MTTTIAVLLNANDVDMLCKPSTWLQRLMNKLNKFCTFSSLDVNLSKTKIMICDRNIRKLNQEVYIHKYIEIDYLFA